MTPEGPLNHNCSLNSSIQVGSEEAIAIFDLLLELLSFLLDHPALDPLLFFDLSSLLPCCILLNKKLGELSALYEALPMPLNDYG